MLIWACTHRNTILRKDNSNIKLHTKYKACKNHEEQLSHTLDLENYKTKDNHFLERIK